MRDQAIKTRAAARRERARATQANGARPTLARLGVAVALALGAMQAAHAIGIVDAYQAALEHDPEFAGAMADKRAGDANVAIGRSYLLPNLSASYGTYRDWTNTTYLGETSGPPSSYNVYHAYSASVQVRQPIINLEGIARYRYGKAAALASDAVFMGKSEDLLVRVLSAYTDTLFALDQVALATAQQKTFEAQLASNEAQFKNGQGTRTDILETNSKLEISRADLADAQDNLDNSAHALEAITGLSATLDVAGLDRLSEHFEPTLPSPAGFDQWRDIALDSNSDLIAQRHSVEAARQQMQVARAGYYPHVDLVASIGKNQSNSLDTIGQRYFTKQAGIEITIPLYSGGMVKASTEQASANYDHAQDDLRDKTNKVLLELRKQYNLCNSSMTRIQALEKAVESATLQITATRKSVDAGVRTNVDVLTATQQLYQSKRDLARARYQYMIASLQLKRAAGILNEQDLYVLADWFRPDGAGALSKANPAHMPTIVSVK
ncbi:protease secretion system outer membrane protein [Paraburkholderia unamae]|uniref:TolC family outer membrane protein n=1 Tax=Paraburkholderia unamae TaxID=219649 RepID=UPI000DC229D7|nr:TolC family outer membrane protein [Paraburkholderia unamae]RAR60481.1 protease secretion system outer membrane protein [Paraburkholderia unamae]